MYRDGAAELVAAFGLAEELGDVVGLGQPLAGQYAGGVGGGGQPDHPPAGEQFPQGRERGHGVALARPGRGDQRRARGRRGEHHHHGGGLLSVETGPGDGLAGRGRR